MQREEQLKLTPEGSDRTMRLRLSKDLTADVEHKTTISKLDIIQKLSWGPATFASLGEYLGVKWCSSLQHSWSYHFAPCR